MRLEHPILLRLAPGAAVVALGLALAPSPAPADEEVPIAVRQEIEGLLKAKASALLSEKDAEGRSFKRGSYSRTLHPVDDSSYTVTFHRDTAYPGDLLTERLLLTVRSDPEGKHWELANEDLQDSYRRLTRAIPGDEQFFRFERLSFGREGMTIVATNGYLIKDFRNREVAGLMLGATDLAWDYLPPLERDHQILAYLRRERPEDMYLRPDYASISCDSKTCEQILAASVVGLAPATRDQLNEALRRAYDKTQDDLAEARRDNPFSGFDLPLEPDRRQFAVAIGKLLPEKAVGLSFDSYEPKEVTFWSSGLGGLFTYYGEESRGSNSNPHDLEARSDSDARLYRVTGIRGTVDLAIGEVERMTADVTFSLTTRTPLREIPLFIASAFPFHRTEDAATKRPHLFVNALDDGEGDDLTLVWTSQGSGVVVLPAEVPAGTRLTLHMVFENRDALFKYTSTYTYINREGWLPFVRLGELIPRFDLTVRVPDRYQVLGIGDRVAEEVEDGIRTTRWVAPSPVSFPTMVFGVYLSETSKVHVTKRDGTRIPVIAYVDRDTLSNKRMFMVDEVGSDFGLNVADLGKIGPKILGKIADEAANSLNLYREIFGVDYPYGKLDLVNDALDSRGAFYGQAPSSLVFLGSGAYLGEGKVGSLGGGELTRFNRSLVAHEVAHQWWGSRVSNANTYNYWFVESLAEYSSALYIERVYGKNAYQEQVDLWRSAVLEWDQLNSVEDSPILWREGQPAMYSAGPYAFHILRQTVGDEKFFKLIKQLAQELAGHEIVTRDIQRVAEKALGGGMEWFFDQWIRGVGIPDFTVKYHLKANEDGSYMVEGTVDQRIVFGRKQEVLPGRHYQGIFPLTAEMKGDKEARLPIVLKGASTPFQFRLLEKPKAIVANKYGEILAQNVAMKSDS